MHNARVRVTLALLMVGDAHRDECHVVPADSCLSLKLDVPFALIAEAGQ